MPAASRRSSLVRVAGCAIPRREHGLPAILRHHGMEARIPGIRHTAALLKARDDVIFDTAEQRDILREHRYVIGGSRPGQISGVLCRQTKRVVAG